MSSGEELKPGFKLKYKRILLKLSGEALMGSLNYGIDPEIVSFIAKEIETVHVAGVSLAIVIGGGNIFRGLKASSEGMDRTTADHMGMLATAINSLALRDSLEKIGLESRVQSSFEIPSVMEPFVQRKALGHLNKGRILIFAGGTGNPYFTTDTAAALRALEVNAGILLKATKVDGVYDKDPKKHSDAQKFKSVTFREVLEKQLKVMDLSAVALCMENKLPILVYDLFSRGELLKIAGGMETGTFVGGA